MAVITRGDREISLRMETFPTSARKRIEERITTLTAELEARSKAAAPFKTGALRSEIVGRVYSDSSSRIAGYVSVYAPGNSKEYPKAATLEFGTNKPRRIPDHGGIFRRLGKGQKSMESRLTKPARIDAFSYLRGPIEEMKPEINLALNEALAETVAEGT
jgi:hypothetical protein